jgi:hypothetical protein
MGSEGDQLAWLLVDAHKFETLEVQNPSNPSTRKTQDGQAVTFLYRSCITYTGSFDHTGRRQGPTQVDS